MSGEGEDLPAPDSGAEPSEEEALEVFWCLVANVKHERLRPTGDGSGGELVTQVIKAFPPGRKVYVSSEYLTDGSRLIVIGKNRSGRWIKHFVQRRNMENFRATWEFSPAVRRAIAGWQEGNFMFENRTQAEQLADAWNSWGASIEVETVIIDPSLIC